MATSAAYVPGHSPGARIQNGTGTSRAASRCDVRRFGAAYILREVTAVCSAYSLTAEVCSIASCTIAVSRPSVSAPRRSR